MKRKVLIVLLMGLLALLYGCAQEQGGTVLTTAAEKYAAAMLRAEKDPGPASLFKLGAAQEEMGKLGEAINSYRMVAEKYQHEKFSPMASARIAILYYKLGGAESSRSWIKSTRKRYPRFRDVELMEVEIRLERNLVRASRLLEAYIKMEGSNKRFGYESAADCLLTLAYKKNWDKKLLRASYVLWQKAIKVNPKNARNHAKAGQTLFRISGVSQMAIAHLKKAVELASGKDKSGYQKELAALIEKFQEERSMAFNRRMIKEIAAERTRAKSPKERLELAEKEARYRFNLASLLMKMGRYGLAEVEFKRVSQMVPRENLYHVFSLVHMSKIKMSSPKVSEIKEALDLAFRAANTPGFEDNRMANQALDRAVARLCTVRPQCKQVVESSLLRRHVGQQRGQTKKKQ